MGGQGPGILTKNKYYQQPGLDGQFFVPHSGSDSTKIYPRHHRIINRDPRV
jgi:hypothetical protein